jgi:hypothetical protein
MMWSGDTVKIPLFQEISFPLPTVSSIAQLFPSKELLQVSFAAIINNGR